MVADYIKNAFLQQNSFDDVDMYCSPEKQTWMMRMLATFITKSQALIKTGATRSDISAIGSLPRLLRMKSEVRNDDGAALAALEQTVSSELDALEGKLRG